MVKFSYAKNLDVAQTSQDNEKMHKPPHDNAQEKHSLVLKNPNKYILKLAIEKTTQRHHH